MTINNLKIGARLTGAFGLAVVLLCLVAGISLNAMNESERHLEEIVNDNVRKMTLVQTMSEQVHIVSRVMRTIALLDDDARMQQERTKIDAARSAYDEAWSELQKLPASEKAQAIRARIDAAKTTARALNSRFLELAMNHRDKEARELLMANGAPANEAWQLALDENIQMQSEANERDAQSAEASNRFAIKLILVLSALAIMLMISAGVVLTLGITRPLRQAVSVAEAVASGDLSSKIDVTSKDETGQLLQALKSMNENLASIVGEVRASTDTINTASGEISAGNTDLSQRTEEQASSLEETASSMEELTSTVKQNAENARQANQLAISASEIAARGGGVVRSVVDTMTGISDSSKKIADIISVIDGIAFQTNILALNAAVEAARAGEQGRGFAVVAGEVRNLAQRSAAAAKEIKELISNSVAKVETGTELVAQAGKTMEEIVTSVKRVTDIMSEITAASQEQSTGIEQVNQAVSQMDQVTQQNAALVEQAAAAAESLNEEAQNLAKSVAVFKLAHGQQTHASLNSAPVATGEGRSERTTSAKSEIERRSAERPKNVARLPKAKAHPAVPKASASAASKKTGTDDGDWQEF
jgi:methyl-accepting chemotaxis protein